MTALDPCSSVFTTVDIVRIRCCGDLHAPELNPLNPNSGSLGAEPLENTPAACYQRVQSRIAFFLQTLRVGRAFRRGLRAASTQWTAGSHPFSSCVATQTANSGHRVAESVASVLAGLPPKRPRDAQPPEKVLQADRAPFTDPSEAPHHYVWSTKMSRARVYADVNVRRPREYWDYESLSVNWGCVCPPEPAETGFFRGWPHPPAGWMLSNREASPNGLFWYLRCDSLCS